MGERHPSENCAVENWVFILKLLQSADDQVMADSYIKIDDLLVSYRVTLQ